MLGQISGELAGFGVEDQIVLGGDGRGQSVLGLQTLML